MGKSLVEKILRVEGMTCSGCEMRIENTVKKFAGVTAAAADFAKAELTVTFDPEQTKLEEIIQAVEALDYRVEFSPPAAEKTGLKNMNLTQLLGLGIVMFAIYGLIENTVGFNFMPRIDHAAGYGILFTIGLMTSLHCIAMCGGINLSQSMAAKSNTPKLAKFKPGLLYNAGRVISYTLIGGLAGALGSVVSFSGPAKGMVVIVSGVLMIIMGLNMLDVFPWLKKINPRMPKIFGSKIYRSGRKYGPFYIGLFSGLMPCGPLQAMQLYALATGGFIPGALSMFFFSLGTVPLVFGLGAASAFFSSRFTRPMIKASTVLIIVLGLVMINRGLNLSGSSISLASADLSVQTTAASVNVAQIQGDVQTVTTTMASGQYTPFIVQQGIPLQWTIKATADDLNGCNNPLTIPSLNRQIKLVPGDNLITFTPDQLGEIVYTCWMGMISSKISVVADLSQVPANVRQSILQPGAAPKSACSCCAVQ